MELAVRQVVNGEKINNKEAIGDPEALKFYEKFANSILSKIENEKPIIFYTSIIFL